MQIRSTAEQHGAKPKAGIRKGPKTVNRLSELPDKCWKFAPQDDSGIQFFTEAKVGLSSYSFMLDGGSGVNSTTEELIIELLNENEKAGISLKDKRHPIKCFEKWHHTEALRGVAGGAQVKLLGAVVVTVHMTELGKDTGPPVDIRFKICEKGSTDWVGWIVGARAIDCAENGGLGFVPLKHSHTFTKLGIQMIRAERPGGPRLQEGVYSQDITHPVYAIRNSVFDSDDESDAIHYGVAGLKSQHYDEKLESAGVPLVPCCMRAIRS